jgi:hypothetical protein
MERDAQEINKIAAMISAKKAIREELNRRLEDTAVNLYIQWQSPGVLRLHARIGNYPVAVMDLLDDHAEIVYFGEYLLNISMSDPNFFEEIIKVLRPLEDRSKPDREPWKTRCKTNQS